MQPFLLRCVLALTASKSIERLLRGRPYARCALDRFAVAICFFPQRRIFIFSAASVIDETPVKLFFSSSRMSRFSSNGSKARLISIVILCFYSSSPVLRVGIVTFLKCRVTTQRYVSHAAQIPCVTTAFLLAASVGCNALYFRVSMASSICGCFTLARFRCSRYDMHDQVNSSAFCLRAFLDRTPSCAFPSDRTLDKTAIPCSILLAYGNRLLGFARDAAVAFMCRSLVHARYDLSNSHVRCPSSASIESINKLHRSEDLVRT